MTAVRILRTSRASRICVLVLLGIVLLPRATKAQGRGGSNWTTYRADAQHSASMRTDSRISVDSVTKPGAFQFLWKTKLDNQSRQSNSLTEPVLLNSIISYKGFKSLLFIGGSSDNVYSIDYDLNRLFWSRRLRPASGGGTPQCPGGLTAITRATPANPNPVPGAGRGAAPAPPAPAPAGGPTRAGGPAEVSATNRAAAVWAIASDGMVHMLNPQTGEDLTPAVKFLAPNAKVAGAMLVDNVLYAATTDSCANVPNGVWAVNLAGNANTITSWASKGNIAGRAGPTLGVDGTVYVATADGEVVSLQSKTLMPKDSFTAATGFISDPVLFPYRDRQLVAAVNKDGRVYVLDAASLGAADHKTPLFQSAAFAAGATDAEIAAWAEADGTRWVAVSSKGPGTGMQAFKVVDASGAVSLAPAWASHDISAPVSPIVVNGVLFVLAGGISSTGSSSAAVLYALEAATGKTLWTSGTTITSFVDSGHLSAGDGQVYVPAHDNTLYAFGIPLEH
jgi:outer membrane protein assembly factor BamB